MGSSKPMDKLLSIQTIEDTPKGLELLRGDPKDDKSFLLRINDGRIWRKQSDGSLIINTKPTNAEKKRINTRFVSVLYNGYPIILVQTTKKIKKGELLWIDYGKLYQTALDQMHSINDQKEKMKKRKCLFGDIDLK